MTVARPALRYHVDPATGCHVFDGAKTNGYGVVGTSGRGTFRAHRLAYERAKGPIPKSLAREHGVSSCAISNVMTGKRWTGGAR